MLKSSSDSDNNEKAAVSEMITTASHELRSPLTSIIGLTSLLIMQYSGPVTKEQAEQLTIIKNSSENLLKLINEITEFARIETHSIKVNNETINCHKLIENAVSTLLPVATHKNLDLQIVCDNDITITTDPIICAKVIARLVDNAIKFTHQGSIQITTEKHGNLFMIHITDTGIGINDQDKAFLFTPFNKARSIEAGDGAGLGLFIAMQLAKLINVKITYLSEEGRGSRFTLCF